PDCSRPSHSNATRTSGSVGRCAAQRGVPTISAFLRRSGTEGTDHRSADLHPFRIGELFKHRFESGIRLANAFGVLNNGFPISKQTRYGKRHRDTMITDACHAHTVQGCRPTNFEYIIALSHLRAHG